MTTNNTIFTHKEHYLAFRVAWAKTVNAGDLKITSAHHMMYNLLRGRNYDKGFTPITRKSKLENGYTINHGVQTAYITVKRLISYANTSIRDGRDPSSELVHFMKTFDGTVTLEMIAQIQLPETESMTPDYGKYRAVAQYIYTHEKKPQTFQDIENILQEVA